METVILSVRRADVDWSWDLELPAELPLLRLGPMIARALRWTVSDDEPLGGYEVRAWPMNRRLEAQDTLAQAGVWDGTSLVFYPGPAVVGRPEAEAPSNIPSHGWRQLSGAPAQPSAPAKVKPEASGFAWKRVDGE